MAYTLSNKCAKNLSKRTVLLQLIIKNVVTCFFGTQCSYSTLGPVSTWVGDRLLTGKPPWCRTKHPGLSRLPSHPRLVKFG